MRVSVCVAATRADSIAVTVRSLVGQTFKDWELVVIAQGPSADAVPETVERALGNHRATIQLQPGKGASRARNAAVAAAGGDVVAMVDDDCEADPNWLEVLVDRLRDVPQAGIVGGALLAPARGRRGPGNCPACTPAEALYVPSTTTRGAGARVTWLTANVAFRRSALDVLGRFDEFLGPGSHFPVAEDTDFLLRSERLGVATLTTPKAVVRHTYGWRYGARAVWDLQRNYARGNGALAGKLTLLGDSEGRRHLREMRRLTALDWVERRRPVAFPAGVRRYAHFASGYRECVNDFLVDDDGLLRKKHPNRPAR